MSFNQLQPALRDQKIAAELIEKISACKDQTTIMEFCGGHTHAIFKYGIREVLPSTIKMRSGPGCPVCVTSNPDLAKAAVLAAMPDTILATYGDMLKVPGELGSLEKIKADGRDIRIVYSTLDALDIALANPTKKVIFFGVGFETTAPATAASILRARQLGITNYYVSSILKLTIPVTTALLDLGELKVDAVLGPGHVSAVIGSDVWQFLPRDYHVPCVIAGFEPVDILQSIYMIVQQRQAGKCEVSNEYRRAAFPAGNAKALKIMRRVFEPASANWRGFGEIPNSGLKIRSDYAEFDADAVFNPQVNLQPQKTACRCGEVLRGVTEPEGCPLFGRPCTPENPYGPCMVSDEGACAAHYLFSGYRCEAPL